MVQYSLIFLQSEITSGDLPSQNNVSDVESLASIYDVFA